MGRLPPVRATRAALTALAMLVLAPPIHADSASSAPVTPGIDSDTLWVPAEPTRLVTVPTTRALRARALAIGWAATWLSRPIVVQAPSADPNGRTITPVKYALDVTLTAAVGVGCGADLTLAAPFALHQSGAGYGAMVSQNSTELAASALRDPLVGVGFARRWYGGRRSWGVRTHLGLVAPLGNDREFASGGSVVFVPRLVGDLTLGRLYLAAALGARLRDSRRFADITLGSQLESALGLTLDLAPRGLLSLGAELRALPSLVGQEQASADDGRPRLSLIVAEWMAFLNLVPFSSEALTFQLGGGGGLPWSRVRRPEGGTQMTTGITAPDARVFASVRAVFGRPPGSPRTAPAR